MNISAAHVFNLIDYAKYLNINESDLRSLLKDESLDLCNPQNTVSEFEFLAILKTIITNVESPNFGLNYGCYLNINALNFIVEISLNTSSIEQAILLIQQYLNNSFPLITLSVNKNDKHLSLYLDSAIKEVNIRDHLLDVVYCFIYREIELMLADEFTLLLQLPYKNLNEYSIQLNAEISKGDKHEILLDKEVLKANINKKRTKEIELLLPQFMVMISMKNDEYSAFSMQVRNMTLNLCRPEIPTFEQVSKQFPLSIRSIQRKLNNEGQSFRKITDEIKKELSFYLTSSKQMKTQSIAYILGYSGASAYLHAVKRWGDNSN